MTPFFITLYCVFGNKSPTLYEMLRVEDPAWVVQRLVKSPLIFQMLIATRASPVLGITYKLRRATVEVLPISPVLTTIELPLVVIVLSIPPSSGSNTRPARSSKDAEL